MKKISFLALSLLLSLGASAQMSVVKDADRAMKDKKDLKTVLEIVTPAFSNPETSGLAQTYFIPGKAAFQQCDNFTGLAAIQPSKYSMKDTVEMAKILLQGYDFFNKAFPLDSVPNDKGKVKPKYSKDMVNLILGHYYDFLSAGGNLYNSGDYQGAYDAWNVFTSLPSNPVYAKSISKLTNGMGQSIAPTDELISEILYNQGVAAWRLNDLPKTLKAFLDAKNKGYKKKGLYDNAIAVADQMKDDETLLALANEANGLYGGEDPIYVNYIINHYLQAKEYDKAFEIVNAALANDPDNAQYYVILGVLYDNVDKPADGKTAFAKAVELDPRNSAALFHHGRKIYEEAFALADGAPTATAEYEVFYNERFKPLLEEAAKYLEQAWDEDNNNTEPLRYLENIYYNIHDEANLKYTEERMGK